MPNILGQLKSACLEILASDPTGHTQGRIWYNSTEDRIKFDNGTGIRALLKNDLKLVIGNSGTAATNVRLNRAGTGIMQLVLGNDVTAEGSLSTALAQLSSRLENYLDAGKPAFGNAGRLIYVTDTNTLQFDTGSAWQIVGAGVQSASNVGGFAGVFKTLSSNDLKFRSIQSSDSSLTVTQNTDDINITLTNPPTNPFASQEFTSSGSFNVPAGVTRVRLLMSGGGAGGGGGGGRDTGITFGAGGGSGGGGAPPCYFDLEVTPLETLTVTLGAGGGGGAGGASDAAGSPGTAGGDSFILRGSTIIARAPGAPNPGTGGASNSLAGAGGAAAVAAAIDTDYAPQYLAGSPTGAGGNVASGANAQGSTGGATTSGYANASGGFGGRNTGLSSDAVGGGGGAGGSGYKAGGRGGHGGGRERVSTGATSVVRASNVTTVTLGGTGLTIYTAVPFRVGDQVRFGDPSGFTPSSFNGFKTVLSVSGGGFTVSDPGTDGAASVIGTISQSTKGQNGTYGSGGGGGGGGPGTSGGITDYPGDGGAGGNGFAIFSWIGTP